MERVLKSSVVKGSRRRVFIPIVNKSFSKIKPEKYKVGKSWSNTTQEGTSRMKRLLANKKKVA